MHCDNIVRYISRESGSFAIISKDKAAVRNVLEKITWEIHKIKDFNNPNDFIISFVDQNIGIEEARSIQHFTKYSSDGRRTIIIDNLDNMTEQSVNSLLKIVEEPPLGVTFIIIAPSSESKYRTLLSRCQTLALRINPNPDEDCTIRRYKQILENSAIASDGSLEGAFYLLINRIIKYKLQIEQAELFPRELSLLKTIDVPLDRLVYDAKNTLDFLYRALEMKINQDSIAVALAAKIHQRPIN